MRQLHELSAFQRLWRYVALGGLSIVFEEANPIWGGIHARHGRLSFLGVLAAVAIGTWLASLALYGLGYWRIEWVQRRFPKKQRLLDAALRIVQRHPWRASLAIRFAYWLRIPLPIACGAARVPFTLYVLASGISCWLWALAFTALGYWASAPALRVLAYAGRTDVQLALIGVVLAAILFVVIRRRRHLAERTARAISGEEIALMTTDERRTPILPLRRVREDPDARQ